MRITICSRASLASPRAALALVVSALVVVAACDCGAPPLVDGGETDASSGPDEREDAGPREDGGSVDGGLEPPPTLEQLARELCLAYTRGLTNLERHRALESAPPRCSNEDLAPDVTPDEAPPLGACALQDPLRQLFLRALSGGRVDIDLDAFRACLAKGRAARAATPTLGDLQEREARLEALALDEDCRAAVTPLVSEAGAACVQAWDCAAPLACEANPLDSFSLQCLPPALEGARCDEAPPHDEVLPLRSCAEGLACVLGVCTRRLAANATCSGAVPCADGLACRSSGTCGAPSGESGPCQANDDCADGLLCDGGTETCVSVPAPLDDGEPCGSSSECAGLCSVCRPDEGGEGSTCQDRAPAGGSCSVHAHCRAGLYCDGATGTCAPYRELDESCGVTEPCRAGLLCTDQAPPGADPPEPTDGGRRCQEPRALGESCQRFGVWRCEGELACVDDVCRAGDFDDPCLTDTDCREDALCVASVCARAPRAGAPCTSDGRCGEGLLCREGRCRELPAPGEPCGPGRRCGEGAFCPVGESTCEALRPPGQACTADGQCRTGVCLDTLTCGGEGASCLTTERAFVQLVGLALLLPLLSLARRRRRR